MKKNKIITCLTAATLLVACSSGENEPMVPDVPDTPVGEYVKVRFTTADASTRAVWADPNGSGSLFFNWEKYSGNGAGLVVGLATGSEYLSAWLSEAPPEDEVETYGSLVTVEPVAEEDGYSNRANFETVKYYVPTDVGHATCVHAVTPFDQSVFRLNELNATAEMPDVFSQTASKDPSFLRNYMFMCGAAEMTDGSASIAFEHIPATFRFIVTNKRPGDATIKSVKISRDDGGNMGSTQLALSARAADAEISKAYTSPCSAITTSITGDGAALAPDATYIAYAMALPIGNVDTGKLDENAFSGKQIKFTIEAGDPD
ncbi:MAG: hypothetical protein IJ467_07305, partial [Bacteroidaceae bacterium]|nr:hypothetical protein [Bacteroidaceae bacterium]